MNIDRLKAAGIDYEAGLKRFMDDDELYGIVLAAFVDDNVLERARAAYRAGDRQALLGAVHEAKGASGNADLTRVYAEACALVTLLRGAECSQEALSEAYDRFDGAYSAVRAGIKAALEE